MHTLQFATRLDESIAAYDLLRHPFYHAWSRGKLTPEDLAEYAQDYYHHVESFPRALARFARRLGRGELRAVVLANLHEELGSRSCDSHAALWVNFAEGVGVRTPISTKPSPGVRELLDFFERVASEGTPEEALATFFAYESQVPKISETKLYGLRKFYGADGRTCQYFLVHISADRYHAQAWRMQLEKRITLYPQLAASALAAASRAASVLWKALDGIESARIERMTGDRTESAKNSILI